MTGQHVYRARHQRALGFIRSSLTWAVFLGLLVILAALGCLAGILIFIYTVTS